MYMIFEYEIIENNFVTIRNSYNLKNNSDTEQIKIKVNLI
jgi:hypothetical protein